jgi:heme/copper-type cytochrome/quinol oxidase subunit 2
MSRIRLASVVLYVIFLLTSIITANSMEKLDQQRLGVHITVFLVSIFFIIIGFGTALMCILYRPQRTRSASLPSDSSGASNSYLVHKVADDSKQTIVFPASSDVRSLNYIFLQPLTTLTLQVLLATLSVVLVVSQKFAPAEDPKLWCGLSNGEISWGYSNTLCMMMVLMPAWAGLHSYLEAQRSLRE